MVAGAMGAGICCPPHTHPMRRIPIPSLLHLCMVVCLLACILFRSGLLSLPLSVLLPQSYVPHSTLEQLPCTGGIAPRASGTLRAAALGAHLTVGTTALQAHCRHTQQNRLQHKPAQRAASNSCKQHKGTARRTARSGVARVKNK